MTRLRNVVRLDTLFRPLRHPNPWEGRVVCPACGDDEWTLPVNPRRLPGRWRCVSCRLNFDLTAHAEVADAG